MRKAKKIAMGARLLVGLGLVVACSNVLLEEYGDTLSNYLGGSTPTNSGTGGDGEGTYSVEECLAEGREISREVESEGAVLLRNENNALPPCQGTEGHDSWCPVLQLHQWRNGIGRRKVR